VARASTNVPPAVASDAIVGQLSPPDAINTPPAGPPSMSERNEGVCAETPAREPTARLFVAVWPPDKVVGLLEALCRPEVDGVRWTTAEQWHVTIAFLGNVPESRIEEVAAALRDAAARAAGPIEAELGPATARLGSGVLSVPVAGLEGLARDVRAAIAAVTAIDTVSSGERAFHGHLTLARGKGGRRVPGFLGGAPIEARWTVREVCLVRSSLTSHGARYTTLVRATVPC